MRRPGALVPGFGLLGLVAACAAGCAAREASAPAAPEGKAEQPASAVEEDPEAALDRAEAELDALLRADRGPEAGLGAAPADRRASEPVTEPQEEGADGDSGGAADDAPRARPLGESGGPCAYACKALDSMRRAASHLCALTAPDAPRCVAARARVERATDRVRDRCPRCP